MKPELVTQFKALYKQEFGEELSDQEALARATSLLNLFEAIYRPIPIERLPVYKEVEACYNERIESSS